MYDPTVGRFISLDPIGFDGADTNTSRYCGNSPTNAMDPSGEAVGHALAWMNNYAEYYICYTIGGKTYNETHTTVQQLYDSFWMIDKNNGKIVQLIIKGHGSPDSIADHFKDHFFDVISSDEKNTKLDMVIGENHVDIRDLLRRITDGNTSISLRGCLTADCAKKVAFSLQNGATVSGNAYYTLGIPTTKWNISYGWINYSFVGLPEKLKPKLEAAQRAKNAAEIKARDEAAAREQAAQAKLPAPPKQPSPRPQQ